MVYTPMIWQPPLAGCIRVSTTIRLVINGNALTDPDGGLCEMFLAVKPLVLFGLVILPLRTTTID
jgi:hypothetical protein